MKKKRFFVAVCALLLAVTFTVSGCGGIRIEEGIDKNKTQLEIANFEGGVGSAWLDALKIRFEDYYKDTPFEDGKKGAQLRLIKDKANYSPTQLKSGTIDVVFTEYFSYYDFVSANALLPVTDIITTPLSEYGEEKTIKSKLNASESSYLDADGQYYALPHFEVYGGMVYNTALFDDKLLYFNESGNFVSSLDEKRSAGPDGLYDTIDDGLPADYEQFYKLCDQMILLGITPMVWSGQHLRGQSDYLISALYADYEGAEDLLLNYSFNGTAHHIVQSVGPDGTVNLKGNIEIKPETGFELSQQAGRYHVLSFLKQIIARGYFSGKSFNLTYSHTDAQEDFIKGRFENNPIGILVDGSWWENEAIAAGKFDRLTGEAAYENQKFGWMPLPRAPGRGNHSPLLVNQNYSYALIASAIAPNKLELAKTFLRFAYTDESLQEFTVTTGMRKGMIYDLSEAQKSKLSHYGRSLWDMKGYADIIVPVGTSELFLYNQRELQYGRERWNSIVGGTLYNTPAKAMRDNDTLGASAYFAGLSVSQTSWEGLYGRYWR